jgi:large subunit ribosomal protein L4
MSKLAVCDMSGANVGHYDVADGLLVLDKGSQAVHDVVVATLAGRRAGTASTLRKGEVAGSNRKPWRQKGTGRARAGLRQSPVWRGGGVAFGPHPRSYAQKINRKVARLAFRRAFSEKVAAESVRVLEELAVPEPKTRCFRELLKALQIPGKALFVVDKLDRKAVLASRNIPGISLATAAEVGTYELLSHPVVVVTRAAMDRLRARLGGGAGGGA